MTEMEGDRFNGSECLSGGMYSAEQLVLGLVHKWNKQFVRCAFFND